MTNDRCRKVSSMPVLRTNFVHQWKYSLKWYSCRWKLQWCHQWSFLEFHLSKQPVLVTFGVPIQPLKSPGLGCSVIVWTICQSVYTFVCKFLDSALCYGRLSRSKSECFMTSTNVVSTSVMQYQNSTVFVMNRLWLLKDWKSMSIPTLRVLFESDSKCVANSFFCYTLVFFNRRYYFFPQKFEKIFQFTS